MLWTPRKHGALYVLNNVWEIGIEGLNARKENPVKAKEEM